MTSTHARCGSSRGLFIYNIYKEKWGKRCLFVLSLQIQLFEYLNFGDLMLILDPWSFSYFAGLVSRAWRAGRSKAWPSWPATSGRSSYRNSRRRPLTSGPTLWWGSGQSSLLHRSLALLNQQVMCAGWRPTLCLTECWTWCVWAPQSTSPEPDIRISCYLLIVFVIVCKMTSLPLLSPADLLNLSK